MSVAIPLPPRPHLEQYKKLAKDFQKACKSSDAGATRLWAARFGGDAERVHQHSQEFRKSNQRASLCKLADAQFFIAREHGFTSWPKFAKHVEALARAGSTVSNFEAAADAIIAGDGDALKKLLSGNPGLVRERSTREHRSTLLHYVSANGCEDFRQKTPQNIVAITKMLIDAGADVNAESDAYGGGSTALGLVATSVHPQRAGVQIDLLQALLARGATMDASYIKNCLANGQPKAAEFLVSQGAPLDIEGAAGLGRLPLVESYFVNASEPQKESALRYACGYGRQEIIRFLLDRGAVPSAPCLHWAAYGLHADVVSLLLQHGAPVDVRDERFGSTPLEVALYVWSNSSDQEERERCYQVIALLVQAGAKLDARWIEEAGSDPRLAVALRGTFRLD